jgi:dihydrofolate reductase
MPHRIARSASIVSGTGTPASRAGGSVPVVGPASAWWTGSVNPWNPGTLECAAVRDFRRLPHEEVKGVLMAKLIYSTIASADGYVEDAAGGFDWGAPGEELFGFINDLERSVGTYLYGRRMYETMLYWETAHTVPGQPSVARDFTGIWQAAEKIVFSKTLQSVPGARTRIERNFDPGMVRQLKSAAEHDMTVAGADLAGQAIKAGLVDELQLFLVPIVIGGGKRALPHGVRSDLELLGTQRFASGAVYLRYRPTSA